MTTYEALAPGQKIEGPKFAVSRESIRLFCDGSLDYNPLHLDDDYMKNSFGKTNFGGIIMHGMNNFGLLTRMLTDWAYPAGGIQRRMETRWLKPVRPGDTIQPSGTIKSKQVTVEVALGADRRGGREPGRRRGRGGRGDGRVPGRGGRHLNSGRIRRSFLADGPAARIDSRATRALRTGQFGRLGRPVCFPSTYGLPRTAFKTQDLTHEGP